MCSSDLKQPTGGGIATAAPTNAYSSRDGAWVLIAANSEPLFARFMTLIGRPELIGADGYRGNRERVANVGALDALISEWSRRHDANELNDANELIALPADADIPSSRAYTAADVAADEQYRARGMIRTVDDPHLGQVLQA